MKVAMNKFFVLCLGLAAMTMTVESSKCWEMCVIFNKMKVKVLGEIRDLKSQLPDEYKKCSGKIVTCSSGNSCKSFIMTMTGDIKDTTGMGRVGGSFDMEANSTYCIPDTATTASEYCSTHETGLTEFESMLTQQGGMIDFNVNCTSLQAASISSAAGFGFGALLVTIVYLLY